MAEKKTVQHTSFEYRDDGTVYSSHYTKSSCRMYPYPKFKPLAVIDGSEQCDYYEKEKRK